MENQSMQADFIDLIEKNKKLIYKVSHLYCDNNIDKKDLFQDIITNLWVSFPNFQNRSKVSTWIYRVSLNTAITWFRDFSRQSKRIEYRSLIPNMTEEYDHSFNELYDRLYQAINILGKIDKAVILLHLEDYSYDEIAEVVGISKTNVATKINRIKIRLKSHLTNN
jgi:RNA polymerase sigma factor (sigma-70 family)